MMDATASLTATVPHLSLTDKAATCGAWALGLALFLTVGWLAMAPDDPLGAVSLLSRRQAVGMWVQAGLLSAIAAALATVFAGRLQPDAGTFAAAIGLTAVSLRGSTTAALLISHAESADGTQSALALLLAFEALAWVAVMAVTVGASVLTMRWCVDKGGNPTHSEDSSDARTLFSSAVAGYELPVLAPPAVSPAARTPVAAGFMHISNTAAATLAAVAVLAEGLGSRMTRHGQSCFVVAAGVCLALYLAHHVAPVRTALWSMLGVWVAAVAAYLWASFQSAPVEALPTIPASRFLRLLPIQFVAVGTAAAVGMFWYMYIPPSDAPPQRSSSGSAARKRWQQGTR